MRRYTKIHPTQKHSVTQINDQVLWDNCDTAVQTGISVEQTGTVIGRLLGHINRKLDSPNK